MKKFLYTLLFAGFGMFQTFAQTAQNGEKYARVRIFLDGQTSQSIRNLGLDCEHGHYRPHTSWETDLSQTDIRILENAGVRYEVLIADVVTHYQEQNNPRNTSSAQPMDNCSDDLDSRYPTPANFRLGSMGGYFTYEQILEHLDSMCSKYPQLISCRQAIDPNNRTVQNRVLHYVKISDNPNLSEPEPQALYTALHHAREPLSASQLIMYMWYLLENYQNSPEIRYLVNNTELFFIPCVNPDGLVYNQTNNPNGGGMWRKNRRPNANGSFGVDLNRNYGYAFAFDNIGSSPNQSSDTYRGTAAFSEAETQNIRSFCTARNIKISLNYHSYGNMLIYPWAHNSQTTPDHNLFVEFTDFMTQENAYITGTNTTTVGYNTNGDADDWLYGEQTTKNKTLAMTPEAGANQYGFYPPSAEIIRLSKECIAQNLALPRFLLNYAQVRPVIAPIWTSLQHDFEYEIKKYGFGTAPFTLSLQPISNNIGAVGNANVHNLSQFQSQNASISVSLKPSIQPNEEIVFLMVLDNGTLQLIDTIRKIYGNQALIFADSCDSMNHWANLGTAGWGITGATYHSASYCITDSDGRNYQNNQFSEFLFMQRLDLSQAQDASLKFWAKWEIEDNYDYVQVLASDISGNFVPLCGLYTNPGSTDQAANQPLYDGNQSAWVQENISLRDFVGNANVQLKLRLVSDGGQNMDGFYFDDLEIHTTDARIVNVNEPTQFVPVAAAAYPNPAQTQVYIPLTGLDIQTNETAQLLVYNQMGQCVHTHTLQTQTAGLFLDISQWTRGAYFYQIRSAQSLSPAQKLIVD